MTVIEKILQIEQEYGFQNIFKVGLANRFEDKSVERIYMDNLFLSKGNRHKHLVVYLKKVFDKFIFDKYLVCFAVQEERKIGKKEALKSLLMELKQCEILFCEMYYKSIFDVEDDWWIHYFFSLDQKLNLEKYFEVILGCHLGQEKCLPVEVYFVDADFNYVINIYDDRGLDVFYL